MAHNKFVLSIKLIKYFTVFQTLCLLFYNTNKLKNLFIYFFHFNIIKTYLYPF